MVVLENSRTDFRLESFFPLFPQVVLLRKKKKSEGGGDVEDLVTYRFSFLSSPEQMFAYAGMEIRERGLSGTRPKLGNRYNF